MFGEYRSLIQTATVACRREVFNTPTKHCDVFTNAHYFLYVIHNPPT